MKRESLDRERNRDFFDRASSMLGDFLLILLRRQSLCLLNQRLGLAQLRVGDGLFLAAFGVTPDIGAEQVASGFDGVHGPDTMSLVIMVGDRQRAISLPKVAQFRRIVVLRLRLETGGECQNDQQGRADTTALKESNAHFSPRFARCAFRSGLMR